jgi:hypothetical protein
LKGFSAGLADILKISVILGINRVRWITIPQREQRFQQGVSYSQTAQMQARKISICNAANSGNMEVAEM